MQPEYYWLHLSLAEAQLFVDGLDRRYHAAWEQARLVADVQARCAGNRNGIGLDFPWEREARLAAQAPPTPEELERLKEWSKRVEERMREKAAGVKDKETKG